MERLAAFRRSYRISFAVALLLWMIFMIAVFHLERIGCICSLLSVEQTKHKIDGKLLAFIPDLDTTSEVFTFYSAPCEHGKTIRVYVDAFTGTYVGSILP